MVLIDMILIGRAGRRHAYREAWWFRYEMKAEAEDWLRGVIARDEIGGNFRRMKRVSLHYLRTCADLAGPVELQDAPDLAVHSVQNMDEGP